MLSRARGRAAEHRLELISQRGRAPTRPSPPIRTSRPRPRAPPAGSANCSTPASRPARSPSCSGSTPSPRCTSRPWPTPTSPTNCAARAVLRAARGARGGVALRSAARFGANDALLDDAVDLPSQVRAVLSTKGWTSTPRPAPARSGSAGSHWRPWCGWPTTSTGPGLGRRSAISWRSWTSGRAPSTPPRSRA
ncbi:hypothetical protein NKH77_34815 [Streptomyces sp. M19]